MNGEVLLAVCGLLVAGAAGQPPLRKGVSVQMPVTTSAAAMPDADAPDSLIVALTFGGNLYLEVDRLTPAQLTERLKAALKNRPAKRVYFKGDARAAYSAVAEVLATLRTAGVKAPILLTSQQDPSDTPIVPPKGLEVQIAPPPSSANSVTLKPGDTPVSDAELKRNAQRGRPVVLEADAKMPFGDLVHAIDVCHAAGAEVFLAAPATSR